MKAASEFSSKVSAAFSYIVEPVQLAFQLPWEQRIIWTVYLPYISYSEQSYPENYNFFFCSARLHTPTQTCWINLLLSAQIRTYHPFVTELLRNKNRIQGKTNITVDIKKKVLWNESLHSSDSKHRLFLALCKLSAIIFFFSYEHSWYIGLSPLKKKN